MRVPFEHTTRKLLCRRVVHPASANVQLRRLLSRCRSQPQAPVDNFPDFDGFQLDEDYYREMGLTPEEAAEQLQDTLDVDPGSYTLQDSVAERVATDDLEVGSLATEPEFGPPALLLAGFKDHEFSMVRLTLDSLGGHAVKVIPCVGPLLYETVAEAVEKSEPNWEEPKIYSEHRSGDWGSHRTVLFSGLGEEDRLAVLDVLEDAGLPTLIAAIADRENKDMLVGQVLAEAIQRQRRWKPQKLEVSGMVAELPGEEKGPKGIGSLKFRMPTTRSAPTATTSASGQPGGIGRSQSANNTSPSEASQAAHSLRQGTQYVKTKVDSDAARPAQFREAAASAMAYFDEGAQKSGSRQPDLLREGLQAEQSRTSTTAQNEISVQATASQQRSTQSADDAAPSSSSRKAANGREPSKTAAQGFGITKSKQFAPSARKGGAKSVVPRKSGFKIGGSMSKKESERSSAAEQGAQSSSPAELDTSPEAVEKSFEDTVKGAGKAFMANYEHNTFAKEQRELRESAAAEMQRRAEASRQNGGSNMEASNLIDAVVAGEDVDMVLQKKGQRSEKAEKQLQEEKARRRMEGVLEQMKANAKDLPPEKQEKLARDLKVLEGDKDAVEKVLEEMAAGLDSVPKDDRAVLKAKLKEEAWQPTKDAIGAALACGISADELRKMVDQVEQDKAENRLGWYPSVATVEKKEDLEKAGISAAARS